MVIPGESTSTARRLADADKLASDGRWDEAVREYQRILDEAGDDLVVVTPTRSVQARHLCRQRFAALPADALRKYRDTVDAGARKWLEQGVAERDPRWLHKVVEEAMCSRPGERALDFLGDWAFERGAFEEAEGWWRLLAAPHGEEVPDKKVAQSWEEKLAARRFCYPEPTADPARIRAKQLLARWFRGETLDRDKELTAFRAAHREAAGSLGGKQGRYADLLREWASEALPPVNTWSTFAGAPARAALAGDLPTLLHRPTWQRRLDGAEAHSGDLGPPHKVLSPRELERRLAFHPVIAGGQVIIADARTVRAFDLASGEPAVWYDLVHENSLREEDYGAAFPPLPGARHTLTVAGERVYARLGAQSLGPPKENARAADSHSYLVCLRLAPDGHGRRVCWMHKVGRSGAVAEFFEGAPVVHEGRAYIALSRFDGASVATSIVCYDAETGVPCWRQPVELCEVRDFKLREPRLRHQLLTLAGSHLVYCTNAGAILALESATGRRLWSARYASRGERLSDASPSPRALAACVFANGRLFAAPVDYDRILCLEAESGRVLWESAPLENIVHVVGVARARLIVTTTHDIRAFDCATGRAVRDWRQPGGGDRLPPAGRGLLAGSVVLWPTTAGLRALDQETGQPVARMACNYTYNQIQGNLALADGCLVVAGVTELHAYVAPRRFLEQRRRAAARDPSSAAVRFELALAEADAGEPLSALQDLLSLAQSACADERWQGLPLRQLALARGHTLLLSLAEAARSRQHWEAAAVLLTQAADGRFTPPQRAQAVSRLAIMWSESRQPQQALAAWQQIIEDDRLSTCTCLYGNGGANARLEAIRQMKDLIDAHGATLYAAIEQRALTLFADALNSNNADAVLQLAPRFPQAQATADALAKVASTHPERPGIRAQALRLLLRRPQQDADAQVLADLARAYEAQHCWDSARTVWQRVRERGTHAIGSRVAPIPLGGAEAERLHRAAMAPDEAPAWAPPLVRIWEISLPAASDGSGDTRTARLMTPANEQALAAVGRVFFHEDGDSGPNLVCRDAVTGTICWKRSIEFVPTWLNRHLDLILVCGARDALGIRLEDGVPVWKVSVAALDNADLLDDVPSVRFDSWQLANGRLSCLESRRHLVTIDAEDGALLWSAWARGAQLSLPDPAGRFQPGYHAGKDWLLLQHSGGQGCIFDSRTGELLHELADLGQPWPQAPVSIGPERVCFLADCCRLVAVDLALRKVLWSHAFPRPSITARPPQLAGDARRLLALIDGWQVECLDPGTGKSLWVSGKAEWAAAAGAATEPWQPHWDTEACYFVRGNAIQALALKDGKSLWTLPELGCAWRTIATDLHIVAYPRHRHAPRLPRNMMGPPEAAHAENSSTTFPMLLLDKRNGRLVQRLSFPLGVEEAAVQILAAGAVVVSDGHAWRVRGSP